jgi:putative component of membrane protein insertase Oxa1/YidC/SpoIIIJ protein YidD
MQALHRLHDQRLHVVLLGWRHATSYSCAVNAATAIALRAIAAYQRYISPFKGFCCAYRFHTGCASCSQLGFRAIRRYGLGAGLQVLRSRLQRCGVAHRRFSPASAPRNRQAGFCDLSCDLPCNGADADCACTACDVFSNCGGPFDCGGRKARSSDKDEYVHIPPDTRRHRRPIGENSADEAPWRTP